MTNSTEKANCELDSKCWYRLSKNVKNGQELFTHYGSDFWLQKYLFESNDSEWRFLFYSLQKQSTKPFDLRKFFEYDDDTCAAFLERMMLLPEDKWMGKSAKDVIMFLTEKINIK